MPVDFQKRAIQTALHNLATKIGLRPQRISVFRGFRVLKHELPCLVVGIDKRKCVGREQIEKSSTSKAASELCNLGTEYAAIANAGSAKLYGLNILSENINDEPDNKTRFIFISRNKTVSTGHDKTSIAFTTKNQPGALVKVLNVFDALNINLLYIDSRPSKKNLGEYVFFLDFEGHITDEPSKKVLDLIQLNTNYIKILGSYRKF